MRNFACLLFLSYLTSFFYGRPSRSPPHRRGRKFLRRRRPPNRRRHRDRLQHPHQPEPGPARVHLQRRDGQVGSPMPTSSSTAASATTRGWTSSSLPAVNRAALSSTVADLIGAKDGDNPHIWYDPKTMPALAAKLVDVLSASHAAQAPAYQKNQADFLASMKPELDKIAAMRSATQGTAGHRDRAGLRLHGAGARLQDAQLRFPGEDHETTPSPLRTRPPRSRKASPPRRRRCFSTTARSPIPRPTASRKIAQAAGIPIVGVTETQPLDQPSYVAWMLHELDGVQAALGAK